MKTQNVDRRKKLSQKDCEGGEEREASPPPPPYISPIYRRDILGALCRTKIEEMRLISRAWNAAVAEYPRVLPRITYDMLEVLVGNKTGYKVNKRGYVRQWDGNVVGINIGGMAFQQVRPFQHCCREIQKIAGEELNGVRVYRGVKGKAVVVFRLYAYQKERARMRVVTWRAPNRLTYSTAAALVHFLHHLDGRCVRQLRIRLKPPTAAAETTVTRRGRNEGRLNSKLFDVYRRATGRGLRFYAQDVCEEKGHLGDELPTGEELMRTARQLARSVHSFTSTFSTVDEVLEQLSAARTWCKKLRLCPTANAFFSAEHIDQLLMHFVNSTDVNDFKKLVPTFSIRFPHIAGWPTTCPSEAVRQVVKSSTDPYGVDWYDLHHELDINGRGGKEGTSPKLRVALNLWSCEWGPESFVGVEVHFPRMP